jgi:hypothetical protein
VTLEWLAEAVEFYQPTGTLEDLVPSVRPEFDALVAQATSWGMSPHVRSVGRTCAQQAEQVKLGYSHADLCRSMHVLGHAVDLDLSPNACATYTKLGQWWESRGGVWGGRWAQFGPCGDAGHFHYGFGGAGAVPTSVCPSGVTLEQCKQIREAYLDQAFGEAPAVSSRWGLVAGALVIAAGVAFVWATMRVRPGALAFRENPGTVVDKTDHPTVVEYGVREMFKHKSPRAAARSTAKKLSGSENLFLGPGVVAIDADRLEQNLWRRLVENTVEMRGRFRPDVSLLFVAESTASHFNQKPAVAEEIVRKIEAGVRS